PVDQQGIARDTGQGGVRGNGTRGRHLPPLTGQRTTATGCKPVPFAGAGTPEVATPSRFMHNAWRDYKRVRPGKHRAQGIPRNDVLLATEENVVTDCKTSGRFVTYDLRGTYKGEGFAKGTAGTARLKPLDTWTPEKQEGASGCDSSHYFTSRGDGITANAFYTQGVRFLDTRDPANIRQVGYFVNADSNTWAAYWHKGYVFVADLQRGVDVLKFDGSGSGMATVKAPPQRSTATKLQFSRNVFGGLCPLAAPA
ncbi:MAG: hypothetical protein QOG68_994, partial [Solirubrobacteraceae bacterium]|nr:hypothetical protein [Solirubrobacteraceae bacterium]